MLRRVVAFLFVGLLTIEVENLAIQDSTISASLQALIDDAKEALERLRAVLKGDIMMAEDELDSLFDTFITDSDTTMKSGLESIQQEAETIYKEVTVIKDLALSGNVDISSCLQGREDTLKTLPGLKAEELNNCTLDKVHDAFKVIKDSKYFVDITITRVEALEKQLGVCGENATDACVKPILDLIEEELVKLPTEIKIEVNEAKELFKPLGSSVQECSDLAVEEYASIANGILGEIAKCVNDLTGVRRYNFEQIIINSIVY